MTRQLYKKITRQTGGGGGDGVPHCRRSERKRHLAVSPGPVVRARPPSSTVAVFVTKPATADVDRHRRTLVPVSRINKPSSSSSSPLSLSLPHSRFSRTPHFRTKYIRRDRFLCLPTGNRHPVYKRNNSAHSNNIYIYINTYYTSNRVSSRPKRSSVMSELAAENNVPDVVQVRTFQNRTSG